jgi:hypothetical protein
MANFIYEMAQRQLDATKCTESQRASASCRLCRYPVEDNHCVRGPSEDWFHPQCLRSLLATSTAQYTSELPPQWCADRREHRHQCCRSELVRKHAAL